MKTKQALIAIGGHASRLKKDGIFVPLSKAFLVLNNKPLVYWCLFFIYKAGIKKIVLAADTKSTFNAGKKIIDSLPFKFNKVDLFLNKNMGADALCYQTRKLLDDQYFLECGHSFFKSSHYQKMDKLKNKDNIVFTSFDRDLSRDRQFIEIQKNKIKVVKSSKTAICSPMIIDKNYANKFHDLNYNLDSIVNFYGESNQLVLINSDMPIEFDTADEHNSALKYYTKVLKSLR